MTTQHTPGPWKVSSQEYQEACRNELEWDSCNLTVIDVPAHGAAIHVFGATQKVADERANLIAAAPDLLAALEQIVEGLEVPMLGNDTVAGNLPITKRDIAKIARAAIAKAKGE